MFGFGGSSKSNQTYVVALPHTIPNPVVATDPSTYVDPLSINPLHLPVVTVPGPGQILVEPPPVPVSTPIPVTPTAPSNFRTGTNLASMESVTYNQYNAASGPPTGNYPQYSTTLLNYLASQGVANVRFLFSWEAVQSNLGGTIPSAIGGNYATYWQAYTGIINALLSRDIKVFIEPWQFSPSTGDTNICYRGATFTTANFQDFWGKMATAINLATNNNQGVSFGLINEPHQGAIVGGSSVSSWYSYAQAAINGIRNTGNINTIYVPGWSYADSASFVSNGSAAQHLLLTDSANNLGVSVHNYNGQLSNQGSSSTTALRDACSGLMSWARSNGIKKINIGEVAIDNGNPHGSLSTAQNQWADWQAFCISNKDIITGWFWWACSEQGWWNTEDSSSGYHWGLTTNDSTGSTYMTLIQSTLGRF